MNQSFKWMRRLSIICYALAGIAAMCACLPLKVLMDGILIMSAPDTLEHRSGGDMSGPVGFFLVVFAASVAAVGWAAAFALFKAGRKLSRKAHTGG